MSPVRRYFLICDRIDMMCSTASQHRMNCLRAMADQIGDEAGEALADECLGMATTELFTGLAQAFGKTRN